VSEDLVALLFHDALGWATSEYNTKWNLLLPTGKTTWNAVI
jgi:hypothetical protein